MDASQIVKDLNLPIVEKKELSQKTEISNESAKAACEDSNPVEFVQGKIENAADSLINRNIEIISEDDQQEVCEASDKQESLCKDSAELEGKENVETIQKETIEILNVEVVAKATDNFVESALVSNNALSELNENENGSFASADIDMEENMEKRGHVQNETALEEHNEPAKTTGLSLLAQYQSDDDTDSVVEVPLTAAQDYRNQVLEIDSSSDSDDSSSSSGVEYLNELRKTIEKRIEVVDEDDGEDEDQDDCTSKRRQQQKLRVKGELLLEDLPPIQDLQITVPENDCVEFGKIHSIVDQLVLVSALPNSILLDLETVIFLDKGQKVLGEVFDVLGQVADPLYCVRFNSNKQIKEKQIEIGEVVYVAPKTQYTQYVILSNLMTTRGSDASWEHDVEPPPRFLDYSDDEQEQLARRQLRNKDRPNNNEDVGKRPRTIHSDDSISASSSYHRNHYEPRNNRGSPARHSNIRPRYHGPDQSLQRAPNHHRSSWHSNYSPQSFPTQPPSNFRMHLPPNQLQSPQAFHSNMPAYGVPNSHNLPYPPPPQSLPYGVPPPMFHHHSQQLMPNTLNIRSATLHGPPPSAPYHHQYTSNPPPPPGSQ